jgi:putative hydrolase of the HAD superfamily
MSWLADVDAVFFDAVGTLIHPEPPAALAYAEVGRRHGSKLAEAVIRQRFAAAFAREEAADAAAGLRTDEGREVRRWWSIVTAVLDDVRDPEMCFADLYEHFARPAAWRVEAEAAAVLRELAARGLVVGVASNFDRRLRGVAAGLPALADVRHLVISSEVGWRKPAPPFFAALAEVAGVPAPRILLAGDDWDNDYVGAQAAGLRVVLFDPRGQAPADGRRICRLAELLG